MQIHGHVGQQAPQAPIFFFDGSTKHYSFLVLPFGLSTVPFLLTKLFKPLVKNWRSEAAAIVVFLDDGLGADAINS